jgi:hypothetical protein
MKWISVKDRLPIDGSGVLVWYVRDSDGPAWLMWNANSIEEMHADFARLGFTHWMEIEPPK